MHSGTQDHYSEAQKGANPSSSKHDSLLDSNKLRRLPTNGTGSLDSRGIVAPLPEPVPIHQQLFNNRLVINTMSSASSPQRTTGKDRNTMREHIEVDVVAGDPLKDSLIPERVESNSQEFHVINRSSMKEPD